MKVPNSKKRYVKPELTAYGNVEKITQGSTSGNFTDAAFPAGTPFKDITLS